MSRALRFPRSMGNQDALMWCAERDPVMRATTAAVTLLERAPDASRLRTRLRRAGRELPRLHQRVVEPPRAFSNPVWADDPHFDLDQHLAFVRAPRGEGLRWLLDLAAASATQGFDRSRPLWSFLVVEDLEGGGAAVVQKLHHAVTDGAAGIALMQRVYDRGPDRPFDAPPTDDSEPAAPGALRLGAAALRAASTRLARVGAARLRELSASPLSSLRDAAGELRSVAHVLRPSLQPLSPLLGKRSGRYRFDTLSVPTASLKAAAHRVRCKLNDAYLAAVAGGWRRYHAHHRKRVQGLRISMPIDLRGAGGAAVAGNRMMPVRLVLPVSERNPARRMRRIRRLVAAEREQPGLAHVETLAGMLGLVPAPLLVSALGAVARSIDFVAACVPGLPIPLYVAGARVEALHTFGPTAGTAANLTLFSYLDRAAVAINTDAAAVPDPEVLLECMREGFDEVLKLG